MIGALKRVIEVSWQIKNVMQDLQALIEQAEHVQVAYIYREANVATDWLSKFGDYIADKWLSTEYDSLDLRAIVQDDRIGHTLVRRCA